MSKGPGRPSCSPAQGSSNTTSARIPYPRQWLLWHQEPPCSYWIGPDLPLFANFIHYPLPLFARLYFLCLSPNNSFFSCHMICKITTLVHMQDTSNSPCNTGRKWGWLHLTSLTAPPMVPSLLNWTLACCTMLPLFPNFSVIPYQSLLHPIGVLICLTFPSVQLPTCTVKSYHSLW